MSKQDLLKVAEALEAEAAALEEDRDEFLDGIESALTRLRRVAGLPKRDLRAALRTNRNGASKP